ncbi:MAG TPA: hypothetical protein VN905_02140 [Candidatus Binatia bacterium]|nr:hypothetical protein [Candidatus Binatia bacterium]
MKHFLIKYRFEHGSREEWHQEIARFIEALESDPVVGGRITYRAMKAKDPDYYHLASTADDEATKVLSDRDFFKRYTEITERVSGGTVEVLPLEIVAETKLKA